MLAGVAPRRSARVLDAGCGSGGNLSTYIRFGEVMGADTNLEASATLSVGATGPSAPPPWVGSPFVTAPSTWCRQTTSSSTSRTTRGSPGVPPRDGGRGSPAPDGPRLQVAVERQRRAGRPLPSLHLSQLEQACRAAGWTLRRTTYFNTMLLPPITDVRWVRQRRGSAFSPTEPAQTGPKVNRVLRIPLALVTGQHHDSVRYSGPVEKGGLGHTSSDRRRRRRQPAASPPAAHR